MQRQVVAPRVRRRVRAQPRKACASAAFRMRLDLLPDAAKLDLRHFSEETRRALYALAVAYYWSRLSEADEYEIPSYSPEEAELTIHFFCRRWFVTWRDLERPDSAPVEDAQPLLQIEQNASRPLGLSFNPL